MQPVRMKTDVPTDLEGVRAMLLAIAPRLESRQPGLTQQLAGVNLQQPMLLVGRSGEAVRVQFDAHGASTAIKIEVQPPARAMGKLRAGFWRWRTRLFVAMLLKRARQMAQQQAKAPREPRVEA